MEFPGQFVPYGKPGLDPAYTCPVTVTQDPYGGYDAGKLYSV